MRVGQNVEFLGSKPVAGVSRGADAYGIDLDAGANGAVEQS